MGYIKIEWPWSQEWLEAIEYNEVTGDPVDEEVLPGPDASVFVDEEIYDKGVTAFLDLQIARLDEELDEERDKEMPWDYGKHFD